MRYIIDQPRSYADLDSLRHDLSVMDVRETPVFRLDQMSLTAQGTAQVLGIGEFPLTEIALNDALRRGGLHIGSCVNFFDEKKEILDESIVNAANAYYRHSRYASSEVKLITRAGEDSQRVALGIPSSRYVLLSHEMAVEKILPQVPPGLKLSRCHVYPEYLEVAFTDPINTAKDAVGEVVEIGCQFLNSQGTRTRSLIAAAFSIRLICVNGSVAADRVFSIKYPHKGNILNGNGEFGGKVAGILDRFSAMMRELPKLGTISVTDRLISQIKPDLNEVLGIKESTKFIEGIDQKIETVMHVWNKVTNLPHRVREAEKKLRLEQVGFKILTMFLHQHN